eukprot:gb/GECG01010670.1/.p1 GENE.gb/GECG01010670.1/~~gb/GECG01010670.1/.p1  ORF type:complete len:355 (+),score=27.78 gb/GECG01010670.1/:1-1065(+)
MIQSIVIINTSGLVMFSQSLTKPLEQPRMVGSLVRTMIEYANNNAGMPLSAISFEKRSVHIASLPGCPLYCVVLADRTDYDREISFGRIFADIVLEHFTQDYNHFLDSTLGHNLKTFLGFRRRLPGIVQVVIRQVLWEMCACKNIKVRFASFIMESSTGFSVVDQVSTVEREGSGYLSQVSSPDVAWALIPLAKISTETLNMLGDDPQEIVLKHPFTVYKKASTTDDMEDQLNDITLNDATESVASRTYVADVAVWYLGGAWLLLATDEYTSEGSNTLKAYAAILLDSIRTLKFIYTGSPDPSPAEEDEVAKALDTRSGTPHTHGFSTEYYGHTGDLEVFEGLTEMADDNEVVS